MAVNVKMGVDLGGFKSGIQQGTQILKGLNAEMKATEAEFKATGDAEKKLEQQTKTLNSQIQTQKNIIDQAQKALKAMKDAGVKETDAAYQQMYATMMKAQTGMYEAQAALNEIGTSAQQAAVGADKLTQSVGAIGKKVSLDAVIGGIDKITGGLEKAAQKAIQLGQTILNEVTNAAKWADDTATMAQIYDIPLERFLQMQKLVQNGMDTSVENMLSAMDRLKRGVGSDSKNTMDTLAQLGLVTTRTIDTGFGLVQESGLVTRDATQLFWQAGQAMMKMGDTFDKEAAATALFGRSWKELVPLFTTYKSAEEYEEALEGVNTNSVEAVENLATLNDKLGTLQGNFDTLKDEVLGALAPGLSAAADALSGLLTEVINYLQTEKGQEMLQSLSDSVSSLFSSLGEIDPASVVESFTTVFNGLVDGLKWIVENKDTLIEALKAVVIGWAGLKLTGGALQIWQMVSGIKNLFGGGGGSTAAAAGATAGGGGAGWMSSFFKETLPLTMPAVLFADSLIRNNKTLNEMEERGRVSLAEYGAKSSAFSGSELYGTWDTLKKYMTVAGGSEDRSKIVDFAQHYMQWFNDEITDTALDEMVDAMSDEGYDNFHDVMTKILSGGMFYSDEDQAQLKQAMDDAIAALEQKMAEDPAVINSVLTVPDDTAQQLATQVGIVDIPARILPNGMAEYSFANGISYVPYDGMLARLHKGERVVPAREAGRNFSSNLYVENMNMNGGLSADALASAIASRNRRVMAGYGS